MTDLKQLAAETPAVYERRAAQFDAERPKVLFERGWLERFLGMCPQRPLVLDAGCGAGEPIARYLLEAGCELVGLDSASAMIEIAAGRFPNARWEVGDMRELSEPEPFDGIVAWHSFFHLAPDDQRSTLVRFAEHLRPAGALLVTVGDRAGEVVGHVGGERVYHSSLSPDEYQAILRGLDLEVVDFVAEDPSCDGATVLLARRNAA